MRGVQDLSVIFLGIDPWYCTRCHYLWVSKDGVGFSRSVSYPYRNPSDHAVAEAQQQSTPRIVIAYHKANARWFLSHYYSIVLSCIQ